MEIHAPETVSGPIADAFARATDNQEPLFLPVAVFTDDRGWSIMNLLHGVLSPQGQINYSTMHPGVIKAWHRHQHQTDFWLCLTGHLKAGIYRDDDARAWMIVIGERRPGVLIIPPMLWHGVATVGPDSSGLLYYVTHAYNADSPDEQRRPHDSFPGFPWQTQHQ